MPVANMSAFKSASPIPIAITLRFYAASIAPIVSTEDAATVGDDKSS